MQSFKKHGLHIELGAAGSVGGGPGASGMSTNDIVLWVRIDEGAWRRPFTKGRVRFVDAVLECKNAEEILKLFPEIQP